jgi:hypothetical protein
MASTSQSWNGICADLPSTPITRAIMATVRALDDVAARLTASISLEPAIAISATTPMTKAASANRVTRKALYAARRGRSRPLQWPMSR